MNAPAVAVVSGVEVVTIPLKDYAELLDIRRRYQLILLDRQQLAMPCRGKLALNPEGSVFLAQRFGLRPLQVLLKECRKEFGAARPPSKSAAYRYWLSLRIQMKADPAKTPGLLSKK